MAPAAEDDLNKRVARKLTKRRKEGHQVTMEIPERFRDGDDADEDCTALPGQNANMNQSIFGMIAAAGSKVDINSRFDAQSSDEEDDPAAQLSQTTQLPGEKVRSRKDSPLEKGHRRKLSDVKLLRSLSSLGARSKSKSSAKDKVLSPSGSALEIPTPARPLDRLDSREAPVMGRMLEARAELSTRPSFDLPRSSKDPKYMAEIQEQPSSHLAHELMKIFQFETPEDVIDEYPCCLLNSVLIRGYMYITTKHVCFYAYAPKESNKELKSGHLTKSGQRYWFRLKGDVLSSYIDSSEKYHYFPHRNIDLRYGISANIVEKEKGNKDATHFTVVTHKRQYTFKADNPESAKEWVKSLQKIIFWSHNDGDAVKISLPIENIIDIEDSQIVDFADTCKIRVIDNDETFAIDEYFFSFSSFGKEALNVLRILVEDTAAQQIPESLLSPPLPIEPHGIHSPKGGLSKRNSIQINREQKGTIPPPIRTPTPGLEESVRATLSPVGVISPRPSKELSRASSDVYRKSVDLKHIGRQSIDEGRRSTSTSRRSLSRDRTGAEPRQFEQHSSSDSYVHSLEEPGSSGILPPMSDDTQASASQILRGSDVFLSPTIQRASSAARHRDPDSALSDESRSASPSRKAEDKPHLRHPNTTGSMEDSSSGQVDASGSAPTLQSIVKASAYPLQRAAGFAGYLNRHSKRMSTLLATESMGYVEKVSGMWKGGKKHYDEPEGLVPDLESYDDRNGEEQAVAGDRFRDHFALPATEKLQAAYFGYLHRVLPLYGKIYISNRSFCFRSLLPGTRTKLILPLQVIENVDKEKGFRFGYSGLVLTIQGREELFFEFKMAELRDDCAVMVLQNKPKVADLKESELLTVEEKENAENASAEHRALQQARIERQTDQKLPRFPGQIQAGSQSVMFDDTHASMLNFKPTESLRITCLTIGSRGDVQPYIALCKGLIAEGHRPRIATHREFQGWVESHGIAFAPVEGDPAELMQICVDYGMFTYQFLREASSKFRGWIDELLSSAWVACQDSDILIESPSAMGGIHIAEALGIPYFRAFSMPWTRTRAYPHAFAVPEHKMGGAYNYITYVMFDNIFWKAIAGQVNRWRQKELGLSATTLEKLQPNKVPFLYAFSPSVVVPPLDYSDWIRVTGYWFLDEGSAADWTPPKELTDFIKTARADGKKLVYVGFGSIVVQDSAALMNIIIKSVMKADVRCILSKGWSDRLDNKESGTVQLPIPPEILQIKSAPHDWLFKQIDAAAHHGGCGTTGASLRAGLPTIIKPFFGDQYFFGSRVEDLGVGIFVRKLNVSVFARALWEACNSQRMIVKAKMLGEMIRKENGVNTAIQSIYRDLDYAKSLIKKRRDGKSSDDAFEESEESWTFIGDDNDADFMKRHEMRDFKDAEAMDQRGLLQDYLSHDKSSSSKAAAREK